MRSISNTFHSSTKSRASSWHRPYSRSPRAPHAGGAPQPWPALSTDCAESGRGLREREWQAWLTGVKRQVMGFYFYISRSKNGGKRRGPRRSRTSACRAGMFSQFTSWIVDLFQPNGRWLRKRQTKTVLVTFILLMTSLNEVCFIMNSRR